MNILITGGAGFIGSHTADALIARGHKIRILDNLTEPVHRNGKPLYVPRDAELIVGDVRSKAEWEKSLENIDVVFHLAAYQDYLTDFSKFFHVNAVGTALLYEIIVEKKLPVKKIIVASSQAVYGEGKYLSASGEVVYPNIRQRIQLEKGKWELDWQGEPVKPHLTDESVVNPQNQYALSKYSQEQIALNLGRGYNLPTVAMRYSIVQGPRQSFYNAYSGACRIFSLSYKFGRQPIIFEDGKQLRDFVNIEDAVDANLLVMEKEEVSYEVFNVGGGRRYTVLEFAKMAAEAYGQPFEPKLSGEFRLGDTRHIMSDISKLSQLGWKPRRDPRYSLECYKTWLYEKDVPEEVLDLSYNKMIASNVLIKAEGKQ